MGCIVTKTNPSSHPPVVNGTSPTVPIYVKSALKTSRTKNEKLSFFKKKSSIVNKSVNFDEKVRVKLRTPTPKKTQYIKSSTKQVFHNDEAYIDDDQASSMSSQEEDINHNKIKSTTTIHSNMILQRNQSNSFWYKNNATVTPSTKNIKEKPQTSLSSPSPPPSQPTVNIITTSPENPNMPIANRFRVRRKIQHSALPQSSSPVSRVQSSPAPTIQSPPLPPVKQRSIVNSNAILIEHHASLPNGGTSSKPTYYAFNRRPTDK